MSNGCEVGYEWVYSTPMPYAREHMTRVVALIKNPNTPENDRRQWRAVLDAIYNPSLKEVTGFENFLNCLEKGEQKVKR